MKTEKLESKEIKEKLNTWDTEQWRNEIHNKSSLQIYRTYKSNIHSEQELYDNSPASIILYKARTNNLNLNIRQRFQNENTSCVMCGEA